MAKSTRGKGKNRIKKKTGSCAEGVYSCAEGVYTFKGEKKTGKKKGGKKR